MKHEAPIYMISYNGALRAVVPCTTNTRQPDLIGCWKYIESADRFDARKVEQDKSEGWEFVHMDRNKVSEAEASTGPLLWDIPAWAIKPETKIVNAI